ncbi:hypothetical protein BSL78_17430 [Apostichopus japonicus]|uniref:Uncharacterized protein n=1 Tax=Stichopus japonicus TaxID=307972 RepID=A0A2G8KCI4_STIJA|nr:hypothetical protein BSL78_17430 [Apostichopus japonicus]
MRGGIWCLKNSAKSTKSTEYAISGHSPSQSPTDKEKIAVDALTGQLFGKSHELINGETVASGSESNTAIAAKRMKIPQCKDGRLFVGVKFKELVLVELLACMKEQVNIVTLRPALRIRHQCSIRAFQ